MITNEKMILHFHRCSECNGILGTVKVNGEKEIQFTVFMMEYFGTCDCNVSEVCENV